MPTSGNLRTRPGTEKQRLASNEGSAEQQPWKEGGKNPNSAQQVITKKMVLQTTNPLQLIKQDGEDGFDSLLSRWVAVWRTANIS